MVAHWLYCYEDVGVANLGVVGLATVALARKQHRAALSGEWAVLQRGDLPGFAEQATLAEAPGVKVPARIGEKQRRSSTSSVVQNAAK